MKTTYLSQFTVSHGTILEPAIPFFYFTWWVRYVRYFFLNIIHPCCSKHLSYRHEPLLAKAVIICCSCLCSSLLRWVKKKPNKIPLCQLKAWSEGPSAIGFALFDLLSPQLFCVLLYLPAEFNLFTSSSTKCYEVGAAKEVDGNPVGIPKHSL